MPSTLKAGLSLPEPLGGGVAPHPLVGREGGGAPLELAAHQRHLLVLHRHELVLEQAGVLGGGGAAVALGGEGVLVLRG